MDLSTTYLGMKLAHPFIPGACPLSIEPDSARHLEDAGAPLIVLPSLFEEAIRSEGLATTAAMDTPKNAFAEALSYLPEPDAFMIGTDEYLDHLRKVKEAVSIPVLGSLNGSTLGGWVDYAAQIEQAGADALELNLYNIPTDLDRPGHELDSESIEIVERVKQAVSIPVSVKLSPFYSSLPFFVNCLDKSGVDGVVLFNRFYQADIDVEELEMQRTLRLSTSSELLMRLRAVAILSGRVNASLAITGGVHTTLDAVKSVMVGAHAVQLVSALMLHGPDYLKKITTEVSQWLEEHEYESLEQMQGSMSLAKSPNPQALTRANYVYILQNWQTTLELGK